MKFWENPASEIDRKIILPKEAFHSVILGENISFDNKIEIKKAVNENIGNIPIIEYNNIS